jgi:2,3-bisphosphoglycerate-independent phosphoglycerate mutase
MNSTPTVLVILDGFGYREQQTYNAIELADTPLINHLLNTYPYTYLKASGHAVGLPKGSIGNSEVGHLTIGAGRIIKQPVVRINAIIEQHELLNDPITQTILTKTKEHTGTIHLLGLLSDANVHSNDHHLYAMLTTLHQQGYTNLVIHPFLDGRDTPPRSAQRYLQRLQSVIDTLGVGIIGSIHGRFYAMDRDHNWDRTEQSYKTLTQEQPIRFDSWQDALTSYYTQSITDEFVPPTQLTHKGIIRNHDTVIFFNFRPDRARQLTAAFVGTEWNAFKRVPPTLTGFITPVAYDTVQKLPTHALLEPIIVRNTLKEVLNAHNVSMFSIAETEKYAHVTYFFNGGKEELLEHEERVLIPSIHARNYVQKPEMSAPLITDAVLKSLNNNPKDFYVVNYANADMVGHSGNLEATIHAIECLDRELERLYKQVVIAMNGTLYITADHGNAEYMFNEQEGQPSTAHTTNPVPFIVVKKELESIVMILSLKELDDIAPFILQHMNIPVPPEMKKYKEDAPL